MVAMKIVYVECAVRENGDVVCAGHIIGKEKELKAFIKPVEDV